MLHCNTKKQKQVNFGLSRRGSPFRFQVVSYHINHTPGLPPPLKKWLTQFRWLKPWGKAMVVILTSSVLMVVGIPGIQKKSWSHYGFLPPSFHGGRSCLLLQSWRHVTLAAATNAATRGREALRWCRVGNLKDGLALSKTNVMCDGKKWMWKKWSGFFWSCEKDRLWYGCFRK